MRAYEFMINETSRRVPIMTPEHKARIAKQQRERQKYVQRRDPLLPIMYAKEDPIDTELRKIELRKHQLELQQLEAEIAQTKAETENEKIKSEVDGMTAVRSMALSALKR